MLTNLKKLIKDRLFWIIAVILIILMIPALYMPSQTDQKAIVTALGIDKSEDEYEISCLVVVPNPSNNTASDSVDMVTASGKSVAEAIHSISLNIGKIIGLAHCDTIVLSDKVLEEDLATTLDYLNRSGELTKNAMLINTPKSSKELLETTISTKNVSSLKLSSVVQYNKEFTFSGDATIDAFYVDYYLPSGVSLIPVVEVEESKDQSSEAGGGGESVMGGGSSGGGGQSESSPSKKLACNGDICVLNKGKKVATLSQNTTVAYNVLNPDTKKGFVYLEGVNGDGLQDAKITLEIRKKDIKKKASFEDDKPKLTYSGEIVFRVVEIMTKDNNLAVIDKVDTHLNKAIIDKFNETIKRDFDEVKETMLATNTDMVLADTLFSTFEGDKWAKYKQSLDDPNEYLQGLQYEIDIKVEGKY